MIENTLTPFEAIGEKKLYRLMNSFYGHVAQYPDLAPIFPNVFTEIARKQTPEGAGNSGDQRE